MLTKLPEWIDPLNAVNHNKRFVGRVNQSRLERLSDIVLDNNRNVSVELDFFYDKALKFPSVKITLETFLQLQCQRSLEPFDFEVNTVFQGVFTESLALTEDLPPEIEVYEVEAGKVSPFSWIEEELLLSIPMVPMAKDSAMPAYQANHPDLELTSQDATTKTPTTSPFAKLKDLKH